MGTPSPRQLAGGSKQAEGMARGGFTAKVIFEHNLPRNGVLGKFFILLDA